MTVQLNIESKLKDALDPELLTVENESHMHSGPASDSHFKITAVVGTFEKLSRVARHQRVYAVLAQELVDGVHALALHLYSPTEWQQREQVAPDSPACRGGTKTD